MADAEVILWDVERNIKLNRLNKASFSLFFYSFILFHTQSPSPSLFICPLCLSLSLALTSYQLQRVVMPSVDFGGELAADGGGKWVEAGIARSQMSPVSGDIIDLSGTASTRAMSILIPTETRIVRI